MVVLFCIQRPSVGLHKDLPRSVRPNHGCVALGSTLIVHNIPINHNLDPPAVSFPKESCGGPFILCYSSSSAIPAPRLVKPVLLLDEDLLLALLRLDRGLGPGALFLEFRGFPA